ncbi:amino acid ABC transporter substrate-binding protein [Loigolactobacillus rennini]|uniref:Glutamine ABC transporter, substrate binding protein n=1 Tax=Loigolactobacillus rennini DSM 20253 TaxID=1423796 RepID=A0A0R2D5U9_9LACO|nr:amino acid ABC transporter substrate-binding protein [Loigolactobacillus rennini]KRM99261.1 glutamine ABC transporter, substrate binding protein [Loigolactobacillus rennini DSM 20253]
MRQKRLIFWLSCLLVVGLLILTGCQRQTAKQDSWPVIKQRQTVVVGLDDSFVPMGFRAKNGQLKGYDIDLARAVFKRYHIKVDFQTIDWSMNATELRNRTIDLIWNGYTITPARKRAVRFSQPYLQNKQVLVTMKKNHLNQFSAMRGKTLGVQTGSSGYASLEAQPQLLKQYIKKQTPVLYSTFNDAFIDLNANRIQGLLIDRVYADYYIQHQSDPQAYRVVSGDFAPENFAVGMRKSDRVLQQKIDAALKVLYQNGTMQRLSQKWFGEDNSLPQK